MNIPEEFGNYLLLKKLREDAMGETFRAGRVGREGIEQVVLLRVFNGPGLDGERLWQKVSGRVAVQRALRSPNIGSGVDLGKMRSFPYVAYDYVSGKNLATLVAQAAKQHQVIPVDHALLVAERLALALAAAYETRVQDERVLHGFVVPHLVMISNEGEARLLGFEVAPGLRELWAGGWHDPDLAAYLAPEASGAAAVGRADDVYSLGAILFELLASERLPAPPAGGYGPLIDSLTLPGEGTPLPAGIAALLKQSLAPREQRIGDAVTWHKTISKLIIDGSFTSTTFNLAFFMHSLFRDEIDRESHEIEAEKKLELPRRTEPAGAPMPGAPAAMALGAAGAAGVAAGGAGAAGAAADMRERSGVRDAAWASGGAAGTAAGGAAAPPSARSAAGSRAPLLIGLAAAALLVLGLGGYFLFGRGAKGAQGSDAAKAAAAVPPAAGAAGAPGAGSAAANAAALQAQIQQMIEARSKDMESKLKGQYDDQIRQLQTKLEESRRTAAAEQEREKGRGERQVAAPSEPAAGGAAAAESAKPHPEPAAPPAATRTAAAAVPPPGGPAVQRDAAGGAAAAPSSTPAGAGAPAVAAPPPPAAAPQIQVGDLVQPGPGVVMPKPTSQPDARYPPGAKRMNRRAEVVVRVLVDEHGRVQQAERVGEPAGLGFDEAAIEAARRTTYVPATKDGVHVKMWYTLKINFVPER
jgi:TonB family protein